MKYGLLYAFRNPPPGQPFPQVYEQIFEQIVFAEQLGFDAVWLTEHHFAPDGYSPSVMPLAAAVAARTRRLSIGTCVLLLPFHHPVRLAEDIAVTDIIANGRLILGVGSGYRVEEFAGYGQDLAERGSLMDEGLEILLGCLREPRFSFTGKHWSVRDVSVTPRPVQQPHPPVFLGRATSRRVLRRAARLGVEGIAGIPSPELYAYFRQELARHNRNPQEMRYLALRWVYTDTSVARAMAEIGPFAQYEHDVYREWWSHQDGRVMSGRLEDDYIVGEPERCVARMQAMVHHPDGLDVEHFVIGQFSGVPHRQAMAHLERLARQVIEPLRMLEAARSNLGHLE